ncbi:hypothetical protein CGLO_13560 [Colletotrichum gloeosporioides Cg-14]|uniref:Uncharacterized protein n=1 Tax=Colletotrichum gloeosporioides (strain Cg-14) TaxID=1237896 RepID=T0L6V9_COLGC|nr:hypothetical protein CGLO_13560 [Colletotrichum gloeosporioides Cg-14]
MPSILIYAGWLSLKNWASLSESDGMDPGNPCHSVSIGKTDGNPYSK